MKNIKLMAFLMLTTIAVTFTSCKDDVEEIKEATSIPADIPDLGMEDPSDYPVINLEYDQLFPESAPEALWGQYIPVSETKEGDIIVVFSFDCNSCSDLSEEYSVLNLTPVVDLDSFDSTNVTVTYKTLEIFENEWGDLDYSFVSETTVTK